jgi:hypothetical protein
LLSAADPLTARSAAQCELLSGADSAARSVLAVRHTHGTSLEFHGQNPAWPGDPFGRRGRSATIREEIGDTAIFAGASPSDAAGWSDQFLRVRVARDALGEPAVRGGFIETRSML